MNPLDSIQASIALLDGRRLLLFSLSGRLVALPLILQSVRFRRIPKILQDTSELHVSIRESIDIRRSDIVEKCFDTSWHSQSVKSFKLESLNNRPSKRRNDLHGNRSDSDYSINLQWNFCHFVSIWQVCRVKRLDIIRRWHGCYRCHGLCTSAFCSKTLRIARLQLFFHRWHPFETNFPCSLHSTMFHFSA